MIEMQYNFPLLPGQPKQWRERLAAEVAKLRDDDFESLRPTFRMDMHELIDVAARWMGMPAERTFLTEGGHHGSLLAMMAAGLAGQTIAAEVLAYTGILVQGKAFGSPLVACDVDHEGLVPESLRAQCVERATVGKPVRGLYTIPTVNNPLGCVASMERREAIVEVAREFDLVILEDDAYAFMAPDAPPPLATLAPERTFYVRGLSKSYAPAARTGFVVVPEKYAEAMFPAIRNSATGGVLANACAAVSLIADGTLDRVIVEKNVEGAARNTAARTMLGDANCWPGAAAAWHVWVKLPESMPSLEFEARLQERGVLISSGTHFAIAPDAPNGVRLALGGEVERERCLDGVRLVAEEMAKG